LLRTLTLKEVQILYRNNLFAALACSQEGIECVGARISWLRWPIFFPMS
jgi:hypothetical protein